MCAMKVNITAADGTNAEISVSSAYNPDILDDMTKRANRSLCEARRKIRKADKESSAELTG